MAYSGSATLVQPHSGAVPAPRCANHRTAEAEWRCTGCGQCFCERCIASRAVDNATIRQCPACGSEPQSLAGPAVRPTFYEKLLSAPIYPLKGWGTLLILFGAIMIAATGFACRFSLRALPVALALSGYTFSYVILIINKSGDGSKEMPNWPSVTVGLITTFFMMLFTMVISFLPVLLYAAGMYFLDLPFKFMVLPLYASLFFLPMAMLRVAMFQTIEALNPIAVIRSIFQIPTAYMMACMVFFFMIYLRVAVGVFSNFIPFVGGFVDTFVALYFSLVEAHILGLLYYAYQERFDWFRDI